MKKFIFVPLVCLLIISMTFPVFANTGHWGEIPLKYMTDNGYLQSGGNPDDAITRLDVAKAVAKLSLIDKGSNYIFTDTSDKDVIKVAKAGIMSGYGNQMFNPNDYITRQEIAKVLGMLIPTASNSELAFSDKESIGGWAVPYVAALASEQIILGYGDGTFKPQNNISRAEFAALFMKVRDKYTMSSITANAFTNASVVPISFLDIPSGYVGLLSIPSLGLTDLPVVEDGENLDNIKTKVGHFINTAIFDGNVGLLGHNFTDKSPWFGKLANIQDGAVIRWKTKFGIREYTVITKQHINVEDWSSLLETGDNRITLITCLAGQSDTTRIMVQGIERN